MRIQGVFRNKLSPTILVSSISFSIVLFFSVITISSFFKPIVYPLIDRVTYSIPFTEIYFIDKYTDQIIIIVVTILWFLTAIKGNFKYFFTGVYGLVISSALLFNEIDINFAAIISLPIILILLIMNYFYKIYFLIFDKQAYVKQISLFGIIIGIISLFLSISDIVSPQIQLPSINYLYYIFLVFSIFSPLMLIIIALSFPFKFIKYYFFSNFKSKIKENSNFSFNSKFLKLKTRIISLILIISLSLFIISIPQYHSINIDNQAIGADSLDYVNFLNPLKESKNYQELSEALLLILLGDRSFSLISFYLFSFLIDPSITLNSIELLPLLITPLLIITIYFLTNELTSNHTISLFAAFLTSISFQVLIGVYGGLYANLFSLLFVNLSILFLIRSMRNPSKKNIILFSLLLLVVLFTHEPTWPIISSIFVIFLFFMIFLNPVNKKIYFLPLLGVLPSFFLELIKILFTKESGIIKGITFAGSQGLGIHDFSTIWWNLVTTSQTYLAGLIGNPIILIFVIYWIFISRIKEKEDFLLLVFISIISIPILFTDYVVLSRIIYEIPFQIPAAIAIIHFRKYFGNIPFITVCLWLVIIAIRYVSNFYFEIKI